MALRWSVPNPKDSVLARGYWEARDDLPTDADDLLVRLCEWMGRWLAVADLAGKSDVGTGFDAREAMEGSLATLGERVAQEMAASASLGDALG